jgi:hypothetical protein
MYLPHQYNNCYTKANPYRMRNRGDAISFYTRAQNPGNGTLFDMNFLFEMLICPQPARLYDGEIDG